jgi:uncharacterized coiled-coil DUF342 family protein
MQKEIAQQIKRIKEGMVQLSASKAMLQKENEQLKSKLEKTNLAVTEQQEIITTLSQKLQALQLVQANMEEEDKKALTKTIDKYIADINKTIILLSQPT